jgi:membrane protein required for colicin V production
MPYADIAIAIVIAVSIAVGFFRGFVKEAMSIASLLVAIWAAFNFGAQVGTLGDSWLSSPELQLWFGRVLIFVVVLMVGGLLSWGVAKLVRLSVLSGTDRVLGMIFGLVRGAVLVAVLVMGGQYSNLDQNNWWQNSILIPYMEFVADWLLVMAPMGLDLIQPVLDSEVLLDVPVPDIT